MEIRPLFFVPVVCLRRLETLSPLASYFSLQGQRKVTKRKALIAQEHSWYQCGQSRIFGLAIHGSTGHLFKMPGARPARRPPGLDAQVDLQIVSSKSEPLTRGTLRIFGRG